MIRSMTGFGRVAGPVGERFHVAVSVRSVNHRYLEVSLRLPEIFWDMEPALRALAGEKFTRGKIDINVRSSRTADAPREVRINSEIAGQVIPKLREMLREQGLNDQLSATDVLRIPDMIEVRTAEDELEDREREALKSLVGAAFDLLTEMRAVEGNALREDLEARLARIKNWVDELESQRGAVVEEMLASWKQRVEELARSSGVAIDPDRLAQETVLYTEKTDIAEELTRLRSHLKQFDELLGGKEAVGKKLDFLSQEMLREINTAGQKSRAVSFRTLVVELKAEVERIREQVQNVE